MIVCAAVARLLTVCATIARTLIDCTVVASCISGGGVCRTRTCCRDCAVGREPSRISSVG